MSAQNATSQPAPAALVEYLAALVQNGSLPLSALIQNGSLPVPTTQSPAPPAVPSTVAVDAPPSAEGRSFTRLGRGQGGALAEKQKASKDITASSTKRKLLVDPEIEPEPPLVLNHPGKSTETKRGVKRAKTTNPPRRAKRSPPVPSRSSVQTVANPDPSVDPIVAPTPPRSVRPVSRASKLRLVAQPPHPPIAGSSQLHATAHSKLISQDLGGIDIPSDDDNECPEGVHDMDGGDSIESDTETSAPTSKHTPLAPAQGVGPMNLIARPPLNLLHAFHPQVGSTPAALQVQSHAAISQSQGPGEKTSKGIRAYPDGWRKALNTAKDIVRSTILLKQPFPEPGKARISANECLHEAVITECESGTILEPGFSWGDGMQSILLNEISTCRGDLKKLAQILVGADPELFPESDDQSFEGQTAPEIRSIAAKMSKKHTKSRPLHDPDHVRDSIADRLVDFAYLNHPPTALGELLANPILEALCRSFYEEERWQRALMVHVNGDDEWISSVTLTMVSLAATSYLHALEEWKSGNPVRKQFEMDKYRGRYTEIFNYITTLLCDDPQADLIASRFKSWAEESEFVQELFD